MVVATRYSNPAYQLSVVGNFLASIVLAGAGFNALAHFFFSVGALMWIVLLVTVSDRVV